MEALSGMLQAFDAVIHLFYLLLGICFICATIIEMDVKKLWLISKVKLLVLSRV